MVLWYRWFLELTSRSWLATNWIIGMWCVILNIVFPLWRGGFRPTKEVNTPSWTRVDDLTYHERVEDVTEQKVISWYSICRSTLEHCFPNHLIAVLWVQEYQRNVETNSYSFSFSLLWAQWVKWIIGLHKTINMITFSKWKNEYFRIVMATQPQPTESRNI